MTPKDEFKHKDENLFNEACEISVKEIEEDTRYGKSPSIHRSQEVVLSQWPLSQTDLQSHPNHLK